MELNAYVVVSVLAVTFFIVGWWQSRLEREADRENRAHLREAKARGADKAIAQFPTIQQDICVGCGSCIRACHEDGALGLVGGVSTLIQAKKCIGLGLCEDACPVGAIIVGLGDVSNRPDIPVLSSNFESSVAGLYIAGELGGIALVRNAVEQGVRAMDDVARRLREEPAAKLPGVRDLLVVGVGPAGLAATFRAIELGLDYETVSLSDVGGTVLKYPRRKLTIVQEISVPLYGRLKGGEYFKEDLLELWTNVIKKHDVKIHTGADLLTVEQGAGFLETKTSAGSFRSRFVVLTLGRRGSPRKLGVPGEESERVLYELMDAATFKNQRVLVVGGGDSAVEAALALAAQPGNQVVLSYRKSEFSRLKSRNKERLDLAVKEKRLYLFLKSEVVSIERGAVVMRADGPEGRKDIRMPNHWVFVFAGGDPPFPLLQKIGVRFGKAPAPAAPRAAAA